jgi:hypothetical protein
VEIGAGEAVATIRETSESAARVPGATLIRYLDTPPLPAAVCPLTSPPRSLCAPLQHQSARHGNAV